MLSYPWSHTLLSILIGIITLSPIAGGAFYSGREHAQWEILGYFDHKGFWYAVIPAVILDIAFKYFILTLLGVSIF